MVRSCDKVVDVVEMYNDEQHRDGESILTLGIDRCGHLYCDCGPEANCDLQHVETKEVHHIITYGVKLATPRRSRRQVVCTSHSELQYYTTQLASQQIKNSMAKYQVCGIPVMNNGTWILMLVCVCMRMWQWQWQCSWSLLFKLFD